MTQTQPADALAPRQGDLFDELLASAPWERRHRVMFARRFIEPRLTAKYPDLATAP